MASRSLGVLTLDLIARTAGFIGGMTAAERSVDRASKSMKSAFSGIKGAVAGAFAGFSIAVAVRKIVAETVEAENAISQLEARLKSTGGVAGVTSRELQDFASELQGITTFSDGAILSMNALLLTFTRIRGEKVKEATRAVLDLATALGQDLNSAAQTVGKALDNPAKGMATLARLGIRFSEQQQKVITSLQKSGDIAGAQSIILAELERRFGGAAEAAANTLGGALKQLENAFGDLFKAKDGVRPLTDAVRELTKVLQDPATVAGVQTLVGLLVRGLTLVVEVAGDAGQALDYIFENRRKSTLFATIEDAGKELGLFGTELERIRDDIEFLEEKRDDFLPGLITLGKNPYNDESIIGVLSKDDIVKRLEELNRQAAILDHRLNGSTGPPRRRGGLPPFEPGEVVDPVQEVRVTVSKIERTEMEKFFDELEAKTRTQEEIALASYAEQRESLEQLWNAGLVSIDEYNSRLQEMSDELLPEIEVSAKRLPIIWEKQTSALTKFQEEAARNTQNIIADTLQSLTDGSEVTFRSILQSFGRMLVQMVQQAIAADIAGKLFGAAGGGTGAGLFAAFGSALGKIGGLIFGVGNLGTAAAAGGAFSGPRASGGPIYPGRSYMVGERGPELIIPRTPGTVIPNSRLGSTTVQIHQTIQAPTEYAGRVTAQQAAAAAARSLAMASRRNN